MKILQISHRVPWPLNEGGTIGIYNYTRGYAEAGADVTLLSLDGKKHQTNTDEALAELGKYAKVTIFPINTDIKPLDAFLNLFSKQSYNVVRFYNKEFKTLIEQTLLNEVFDVIQVEGTFAAPYTSVVMRNKKKALTVLRQHNVEFQIWERLARNEQNPLKKWYLSLLSKRLKEFESQHLNPYDLIVPVTEDDGVIFRQLGCISEIVDAPAGIDTERWKPSEKANLNNCYHLGSLEWMPNQEAMEWFLSDIWPMLVASFPDLRFSLAGKNMPSKFRNLQIPGVSVELSVSDAPAYVEDKGINIVPLKSGSGIRLKILEAMSAGKVVISTTIGAQGIRCIPEKDLLIADTPAEFLNQISKVLQNKDFANSISENARRLIVNEYSNKSVIEKLLKKFEEKKAMITTG